MAGLNVNKAEFIKSAASTQQFIRSSIPAIAFAGKSNVGKSSVINRMLNRKNFARVGAQPGKTIHVNYFFIDGKLYFVDLPGYGYAKVSQSEKERWGKLMESFFAEPDLMDLGVMIVDARHKPTADDVVQKLRLPDGRRRKQARQAEKKRDRAEHGAHPRDPDAAGRGAAHPVLCRKGAGKRAPAGGDNESFIIRAREDGNIS